MNFYKPKCQVATNVKYCEITDLSKYDLNIICNESFLDIIEMDMLSFSQKIDYLITIQFRTSRT